MFEIPRVKSLEGETVEIKATSNFCFWLSSMTMRQDNKPSLDKEALSR